MIVKVIDASSGGAARGAGCPLVVRVRHEVLDIHGGAESQPPHKVNPVCVWEYLYDGRLGREQ